MGLLQFMPAHRTTNASLVLSPHLLPQPLQLLQLLLHLLRNLIALARILQGGGDPISCAADPGPPCSANIAAAPGVACTCVENPTHASGMEQQLQTPATVASVPSAFSISASNVSR